MDELKWHKVCSSDELEMDDVIGINIDGREYAVYRIKEGLFAGDGLCSHEKAKLCKGFVHHGAIECPKHNARFSIKDGKVLRKPGREDLETFSAKEEDSFVFIGL